MTRPNPSRAAKAAVVLVVIVMLAAVAAAFVFKSRTPGDPADLAADTLTPGESAGLEVIGDGEDPIKANDALHDWDTEHLGDSAAKQLKALGKLLTDSAQLSSEQIKSFADPSFRSAWLQPPTLEKVFDDQAVVVERLTESEQPDGEPAMVSGAEGLTAALETLRAPIVGGSDIGVEFKVFGVHPQSDGFRTEVYFQLNGRVDQQATQQRATWLCDWQLADANDKPKLTSIEVIDYEKTTGTGSSGPLFQDYTANVVGDTPVFQEHLGYGVDYWTKRIEQRLLYGPSGFHGIAVGDVNNDGLEDIYLPQPGGLPNRLLVQQADGTVTDIAAAAGVDFLENAQAVLMVDLDDDGDQDLVIGSLFGLLFMTNDGESRFTLESSVLIPEGIPYSISAADYDLDGDLDFYVCSYGQRTQLGNEDLFPTPVPYHDANNGARNSLLRNDGDFKFTNVTKRVGLDHNDTRFSLASAWEDYDNDGDPDLYVANDYGRNNLYRNEGGTFTDVAGEAGVEDISAGMSVSWGDYDNDGWMDVYVSNMWSSAGNRITNQQRFRSGDEEFRSVYRRHARGNSLFRNLGNGKFEDVSETANVTMGRWAWGSRFIDLNNDSLQDVVVANGYITQDDTDDL